jgi:hypothetical protein
VSICAVSRIARALELCPPSTLAARISRTDPCIERIEPHYWDASLTSVSSSREHRHIVFIVDAVARRRRSIYSRVDLLDDIAVFKVLWT